jgi:hypothetical protein
MEVSAAVAGNSFRGYCLAAVGAGVVEEALAAVQEEVLVALAVAEVLMVGVQEEAGKYLYAASYTFTGSLGVGHRNGLAIQSL